MTIFLFPKTSSNGALSSHPGLDRRSSDAQVALATSMSCSEKPIPFHIWIPCGTGFMCRLTTWQPPTVVQVSQYRLCKTVATIPKYLNKALAILLPRDYNTLFHHPAFCNFPVAGQGVGRLSKRAVMSFFHHVVR